jgi:hypothetical protein
MIDDFSIVIVGISSDSLLEQEKSTDVTTAIAAFLKLIFIYCFYLD